MPAYSKEIESPLGTITICSDGAGLCGLWFDEQKHFGKGAPEQMTQAENAIGFEQADKWLDEYFSGNVPNTDVPVSLHGTTFQLAVWELLSEIPYGDTVTYGQLAKTIEERTGKRTSARAVGGAVGRNPVSLIVPCHRVIGANSKLTGYAGGIEKKKTLLALEQAGIMPS